MTFSVGDIAQADTIGIEQGKKELVALNTIVV